MSSIVTFGSLGGKRSLRIMMNKGAGYYLDVFLFCVEIDGRRKVFIYGVKVLRTISAQNLL